MTLEPITIETLTTSPLVVTTPVVETDEPVRSEIVPAVVTCFLCEQESVTTCDYCDQPICKEHMQDFIGWCQTQHAYCPEHHALKMREQGRDN